MKANISSSEMVLDAYLFLKQDTYFDKMDLFLRANIAEYEASGQFQERQNYLASLVDELREGEPCQKSRRAISKWLNKIEFRLLPKSVGFPNEEEKKDQEDSVSPRLISNVRTAKKYIINDDGVHYFIFAPIELYILSTL